LRLIWPLTGPVWQVVCADPEFPVAGANARRRAEAGVRRVPENMRGFWHDEADIAAPETGPRLAM